MVNYRYLGYGVTNDNGVAQLTHDANGDLISNGGGYVGTGAGELDVIASLDNPITSGSVVSDTYQVIDALLRDGGTDSDKNNSMWNNTTYFTRNTNDTTVQYTNSGSGAVEVCRFNNKEDIPMIVELTITENSYFQIRLATYDSNNVARLYGYLALENGETGRLQIIIEPDLVTYKLNGETIGSEPTQATSVNYYFVFRCNGGKTMNFKFKDLCAYPI